MMRKSVLTIVGILFLLASFPICAFSQEVKSRYDVLLERVKKGDPTVDFRELRFAYAETSLYNPYGDGREDLTNAMFLANKDKQYVKSIEYAEKILQDNYVDVDAHMMASFTYDLLGEQDKANFHRFVGRGIAQSIMFSDDGISLKTAIKVISVDEETLLLNMLGLRTISQSELHIDGHSYDKFVVADKETNRQSDMYFCIDIPCNWREKSLKKSK